MVAGSFVTNHNMDHSQFIVLCPPLITTSNVEYRAEDMIPLAVNQASGSGAFYVNNSGQVAGSYNTWGDELIYDDWDFLYYTNWCHRAVFWDIDGTMWDLCTPDKNSLSKSCAVNDLGFALVAYCQDYTTNDWSGSTWSDVTATYVVVPVELDGFSTIWYLDANGDSTNDLAYIIDNSGYSPVAMNNAGTVVFSEGLVVIPDYNDLDGDGNPWFADVDINGVNDLFIPLNALEDAASSFAADINDFGEIAGSSRVDWDDIQAVVWPDPYSEAIDLGKPDRHANRVWSTDINNAGQVLGKYYLKQDNLNYSNRAGSKPFLYENEINVPFRDLNADGQGWELQDINDGGWVIDGDGNIYIPTNCFSGP
jgi:uncharacterized membrane protein